MIPLTRAPTTARTVVMTRATALVAAAVVDVAGIAVAVVAHSGTTGNQKFPMTMS
jgi:hypothetical protein